MTKQRLEQYASLKKEIELLEKELARQRVVSDSVKGSSKHPPYTQRVVTVTGIDMVTLSRLRRRKHRLAKERAEIETWIEGLTDSHMRQLIELRYVKKQSWAQVATNIKGNTPDSARKTVERFLKRK